jgi:hypothetical protein
MDSNLSLDFYLAIYTFTSVAADRPTDRVSWYTIHKWKAVSRFGNLLNLTAMVKRNEKSLMFI